MKQMHTRTTTSIPSPATEPPSARTTEVVRPFDAGGWFPIHNAVFDLIMPQLSPNAWKVLCVAIRQTWGWVADPNGDPKVRREWDRISYSQFQAKSGIKSRATVSKALTECLAKGYLLRYQVGTERGQPTYAYALNRDFEVEWPTGSKNEPVTGTKFEPVTGLKNEPTKQRETNRQNGDGGFTTEQKLSFALLTDFGVSKPVARRITGQSNLSDVRGWLDHAENANGLHSRVAFVVRRLLDGEPVPLESRNRHGNGWRDDSEQRRQRYASEGVLT
jgi:hypothetical protein